MAQSNAITEELKYYADQTLRTDDDPMGWLDADAIGFDGDFSDEALFREKCVREVTPFDSYLLLPRVQKSTSNCICFAPRIAYVGEGSSSPRPLPTGGARPGCRAAFFRSFVECYRRRTGRLFRSIRSPPLSGTESHRLAERHAAQHTSSHSVLLKGHPYMRLRGTVCFCTTFT